MNPQNKQNEHGTIIETNPSEESKPRFVKLSAILGIIGLVGFIAGIALYVITKEPGLLAISAGSLLVIARANHLRHHTTDQFKKMYNTEPKVKKMAWLGVVYSIVIIISVVTLALVVSSKDESDKSQLVGSTDMTNNIKSDGSIASILFNIKNEIADDENFEGFSMVTRTNVANLPVYSENEGYFVMLDSPNGWDLLLEKSNKDARVESQEIADFIIENLRTKNFKNYESLTYDEIIGEGSATYLVRNNELCIIATTPFEIDTECVDLDDLGNEIAENKFFYEAYFLNVDLNDKKSIVLNMYEQSVNSVYPEYTVAKGVIYESANGSDIAFYKVADGDWTYGLQKREPLECTQYKSKDVQKAFNSDSCYDGADLSTVEKYFSL